LKAGKNKITVKYAGNFANILEGYPAHIGLVDGGFTTW
jgi:hypothetical protein